MFVDGSIYIQKFVRRVDDCALHQAVLPFSMIFVCQLSSWLSPAMNVSNISVTFSAVFSILSIVIHLLRSNVLPFIYLLLFLFCLYVLNRVFYQLIHTSHSITSIRKVIIDQNTNQHKIEISRKTSS